MAEEDSALWLQHVRMMRISPWLNQTGNNHHQQLRTAFLELTRDTTNSDDWFSAFSAAINGKGAL